MLIYKIDKIKIGVMQMRKTRLIVLSVILSAAILVGCGGKKVVESTKDNTKTQTITQEGQKDTTSLSSTTSTNDYEKVSKQPTPVLDKLIKEEDDMTLKQQQYPEDMSYAFTEEFSKIHPTNSLFSYLNDKQMVGGVVGYIKFSDTAILYHVYIADTVSNKIKEKRDIKLELKNGVWSVTSDEVIKK